MGQLSASVVISFYNKIDYLRRILAALERQTFKDFEVIVADDGSKPDVVAEVKELQKTSPFPILHVWHEDLGFRKTMILNTAIRTSRTDYLIFMDGDCVPHYRFVEEHYNNREERTILAGRRANISKKLADLLTENNIRAGIMEKGFEWRVMLDGMFGKSTHTIKGVYVSLPFLRKFLNRKVTGVLGSNFSIHKKDLLEINGFDERYQAPAVGEDTDIEVRLVWNNVRIKMIKNLAVQYHFDHPKLKRSQVNMEIFNEVLKLKNPYTEHGLNK
jgi:glycosyltransferase involved in cell wall biosynthesis